MEWQPIETAPIKPFDKADIYGSSSELFLVSDGRIIFTCAYSYTSNGRGRWKNWNGVQHPTHWARMPELPK